ncbi:VPA1262 family N-terminal domain-containing protein [Archangium sp.]|uniref:VPA1262 family N-terminal domain-containing protein n=1 Tax=Archangium sp. TaxID=1872627 RepID=UPI002D6F629F|nr:VPA1262 family N-terminal domain-containing protein [Archangium sp.]HYO55016.1 VPA1262 family N-terminal domain-containing protein [Archangium sp.]
MKREVLGPGRTAYVTRLLLDDPHGAVDFYRGRAGTWPLPEPSQQVRLESLGPLEEVPPSEIPILVTNSGGSEPPGAVLPRREGTLRLYSRLEPQRRLQQFLQPRELEALGRFAQETLGVDLLRFSEYQGAILLCAPNPLLRGMEEWLASDERHLVVEFLEREGCSVQGCWIEVTELQTSGDGFNLRCRVTDSPLIIPIPNRPGAQRTRLFDPSGDCIHESTGAFPNSFHIDAELGGHVRKLKVQLRDGKVEQYRIETVTADRSRNPEKERTAQQLLREARERRELEDLERSRTFVYFEGGEDSKQRATEIVRELLGQARHRCIICDSFLSADDVVRFAPFVRVKHLPIQLLGARSFLKQKLQKDAEETEGDLLLKRLGELSALDPSLVLQCRVMRGSRKSPVHDRFLVVNDDVYLLGSSLNEFGSRATTLFKIPDPRRLIAELEAWWEDPQRSFPLEELRASPPEPEENNEAGS